ncbi:hypothetical protein [Campylobacter concisus]|uniref:hypothetical protein n=1 Tax=Campylobacter concisus TaxID=199 RepID=UPI0018FF8890|nr:hypothetical protein [Campylobacter concisus]
MYFIGIDISSTSTKVAILDNQDNFCDLFLLSSSFSVIKIVRDIKEILEQKGYQYASIVATEYRAEADVVAFESCTGTTNFKNNMSTQGNLVENIAKRYLKTPLFCNVQKRRNI